MPVACCAVGICVRAWTEGGKGCNVKIMARERGEEEEEEGGHERAMQNDKYARITTLKSTTSLAFVVIVLASVASDVKRAPLLSLPSSSPSLLLLSAAQLTIIPFRFLSSSPPPPPSSSRLIRAICISLPRIAAATISGDNTANGGSGWNVLNCCSCCCGGGGGCGCGCGCCGGCFLKPTESKISGATTASTPPPSSRPLAAPRGPASSSARRSPAVHLHLKLPQLEVVKGL